MLRFGLGFFAAATCLHRATAATYGPHIIDSATVSTEPFQWTGYLENSAGYRGSGVSARHPKIVITCAHMVHDGVSNWLGGDFKWVVGWHATSRPMTGQWLRYLYAWSTYDQFVELDRAYGIPEGSSSASTFSVDLACFYAYADTAGGSTGRWALEGLDQLMTTRDKIITGYPANLYDGGPSIFQMTETGPFSRAFYQVTSRYLRHAEASSRGGNSGGPVWFLDDDGHYALGGIYVSGLGGTVGLDASAWSLIGAAAVATGEEPEIVVKGNGYAILSGDTTPSTSDGSDFGSVAINAGHVEHDFVVHNDGAEALAIQSVAINEASFTVEAYPATVAPESTGVLRVRFDPAATGTRNATITIENSDPDEGTYTFGLRGVGEEPQPGKVYSAWREECFGPDADEELSGTGADPDGDGVSNMEEFVAGTNPLIPDGGADQQLRFDADKGTLEYTYRRDVDAEDYIVTIMFSESLDGAWSEMPDAWYTAYSEPVPGEASINRVYAEFQPEHIEDVQRGFLRLQFTQKVYRGMPDGDRRPPWSVTFRLAP